jgi:hypothetical protein
MVTLLIGLVKSFSQTAAAKSIAALPSLPSTARIGRYSKEMCNEMDGQPGVHFEQHLTQEGVGPAMNSSASNMEFHRTGWKFGIST